MSGKVCGDGGVLDLDTLINNKRVELSREARDSHVLRYATT